MEYQDVVQDRMEEASVHQQAFDSTFPKHCVTEPSSLLTAVYILLYSSAGGVKVFHQISKHWGKPTTRIRTKREDTTHTQVGT